MYNEIQPTEATEETPRMDLLDRQLAYTLFRGALGMSLLTGLVTAAFPVANPWGEFGVLFVTAAIGLLLTLGLWTQEALRAGAVFLTALAFVTAAEGDAQTFAAQMAYLALVFLLPAADAYNVFSVDALRSRVGRFARERS